MKIAMWVTCFNGVDEYGPVCVMECCGKVEDKEGINVIKREKGRERERISEIQSGGRTLKTKAYTDRLAYDIEILIYRQTL